MKGLFRRIYRALVFGLPRPQFLQSRGISTPSGGGGGGGGSGPEPCEDVPGLSVYTAQKAEISTDFDDPIDKLNKFVVALPPDDSANEDQRKKRWAKEREAAATAECVNITGVFMPKWGVHYLATLAARNPAYMPEQDFYDHLEFLDFKPGDFVYGRLLAFRRYCLAEVKAGGKKAPYVWFPYVAPTKTYWGGQAYSTGGYPVRFIIYNGYAASYTNESARPGVAQPRAPLEYLVGLWEKAPDAMSIDVKKLGPIPMPTADADATDPTEISAEDAAAINAALDEADEEELRDYLPAFRIWEEVQKSGAVNMMEYVVSCGKPGEKKRDDMEYVMENYGALKELAEADAEVERIMEARGYDTAAAAMEVGDDGVVLFSGSASKRKAGGDFAKPAAKKPKKAPKQKKKKAAKPKPKPKKPKKPTEKKTKKRVVPTLVHKGAAEFKLSTMR
jgi:hypothetical protein